MDPERAGPCSLPQHDLVTEVSNGELPGAPDLLRWTALDPSTLPELLFRDTFRLAVAPVGTNGGSYAEVETDYAEVVVPYRSPGILSCTETRPPGRLRSSRIEAGAGGH